MKPFKKLSKQAQYILGLALSCILTLPAFANQTTAPFANQTTAPITTPSDDQLAESIIVGKALPNSPITNNSAVNQAIAPIGQILQEFGKTQTDNSSTAQANPNTPLPQSTAQAVTPDDLVLNSPVLDYANVLTPSEKQQLSEQLYKIYQDNLAQVALVIVPTTDGVPIFDYTMAVANRFGLGRDGVDDGVLMLVAINDKELFIATGYGVEGVLPDGAIKRIIREDIAPSFRTGAYAQGLSAGIARIDERLRADPETLARTDKAVAQQENPVDIMGLFVPALIIGLFLGNVLGRVLGASLVTGGFAFVALTMGAGVFGVVIGCGLLWLFLVLFAGKTVAVPVSSYRNRGGGFGGGGFGSGGMGGGGFSGGGGSFGGGGAGGSW